MDRMAEDTGKQKVIVLNGLARGGTNIAWNILQSHPNIVSPIYETNQIIGRRSIFAPFQHLIQRGKNIPWIRKQVCLRFNQYKLKNLYALDNQYKYEGQRYTREEIERATLCIKGVCSPRNWDISYSELLHSAFSSVYFVGLIRNGFAICESWRRRGISARKAGKLYARFCDKLLRDKEHFPCYKIIRFEDMLAAPFVMAKYLFEFVGEEKSDIRKLRIKAKRTLDPKRKHTHQYGDLNRKYWFSEKTISEIIRTDINAVQQKGLSPQEQKAFEAEAGEAMRHFRYI